jgi:hypothetical protein
MWLGERFRFNLIDDLNHLLMGFLHPHEAMCATLREGGGKGGEAASGGEESGEVRKVNWGGQKAAGDLRVDGGERRVSGGGYRVDCRGHNHYLYYFLMMY